MDFEDICQIVDTVVDLPVHNKRALLHDLAHRAALVLKVDDDTVFSALLKREELGSTGVGNGVALPHVRLEQVKKPFGILARLKQPIDFDAIDGRPLTSSACCCCQKKMSKRSSMCLPPSPEGFERRKSSSNCAARPIAWCSITSWSEEPACIDPSEAIFNA
jgi:mannitol/fructose-specific phosphotransferase system IIA component (Ntr-type)